MIQCNKCNVQYIGESKRHLSDSFGEYRRAIEKNIIQRHINQPTAVSDHFTLLAHSMDNIELVPLELINSNKDAIRKARETFLISKGKTLEPSGLNLIYFLCIRFSTRFLFLYFCRLIMSNISLSII